MELLFFNEGDDNRFIFWQYKMMYSTTFFRMCEYQQHIRYIITFTLNYEQMTDAKL